MCIRHGRDPDQPIITQQPMLCWLRSASPWAHRLPRCGWHSNYAAASLLTGWRAAAPRSSWVWPSAACTTPVMAASKLAACIVGRRLLRQQLARGHIGLVAPGVLALTLITAVYDAHLLSQTRSDALRPSRSTRRCSTARIFAPRPARPAFLRGSSTSPRARRRGPRTIG
jgi:hypothetical protein